MCQDREHRYSVVVKVTTEAGNDVETTVCCYAHGMVEAVAKADGWAFKNFPMATYVNISCFHTGYTSTRSAIEHGALDIVEPDPRPNSPQEAETLGLT
jgi:hypothetical protein